MANSATLDAFRNLLRVAEAITDFSNGWDKWISGHMVRDRWFIQQGLRSGPYDAPIYQGHHEFRALLKLFGYSPSELDFYEAWFDHPIKKIFGSGGSLSFRITVIRSVLTTLEKEHAKSNIDSTSPGTPPSSSGD